MALQKSYINSRGIYNVQSVQSKVGNICDQERPGDATPGRLPCGMAYSPGSGRSSEGGMPGTGGSLPTRGPRTSGLSSVPGTRGSMPVGCAKKLSLLSVATP